MGTALRRASSRLVGWLADRKLPRPLRTPVYRAYARAYDVDLGELRLALADHPSFTAFFTRRLIDTARVMPEDPGVLPSPCDGTLQALDPIERGTVLQAKGRPYPIAELLGDAGGDVDLEGGLAWTIYLSPRDYHRVHCPVTGSLVSVRWLPGDLFSVHPRVLARRARVLSINERAVLRLEGPAGPLFLVMVGALNVGRIRVVGVAPGTDVAGGAPMSFARGDELARFEMGSTVVLLAPRNAWKPVASLQPGQSLRLGTPLGEPAG